MAKYISLEILDPDLQIEWKSQHLTIVPSYPNQGLLHRWTSQLDLVITAGGLGRAVPVHNST